MKKLMILMLVLGLASLANADLVFTVNGEPQPDEVWLFPSNVIELGLKLSAGETILSYDIEYVLNNSYAELIIDGASGSYPSITEVMTDIEFPAPFDFAGKVVGTPTSTSVRISAGQFTNPALVGPQTLMAELYLHCLEATNDVILEIIVAGTTIIDGQAIPNGTLLHTLTIHQVPEPMTMALLGLGGLFLRRRK